MNGFRIRWSVAALAVGALTVGACGNDPTGPERGYGTIVVSFATVGVSVDPDGYEVGLSGRGDPQLVGVSGTITFDDVPVGPRRVSLRGVGVTCDPEGGYVRDVTVERFLTTMVQWSVVCTEKPIVFSSRRANPRQPALYRMNMDGTGVKSLGPVPGHTPRWSPDGSQILFTDGASIYVIAADGGDARLLTEGFEGTWSPDGGRIAFSRYMDEWGATSQVFTARANGGDERALTPDRFAYNPDWGPDGRIVFVEWSPTDGTFWLTTVNAAGSEPTRVHQGFGLGGPAWSPDGTRIAFVATEQDEPGLYTIGSDGTGLRRRNAMPFFEAEPRWLADGTTLLFTHYDSVDPLRSDLRLGQLDSDTSLPISHFPGTDRTGDVLRPR